MSYTIVPDRGETDRRWENIVNHIMRRCRIGKVTLKRPASLPNGFMPMVRSLQWPVVNDIPQNEFMPKCGCRIGTACGNAACPHAPVAMGYSDLKALAASLV